MLEVGSLVDGKYKILNEIGRGGMSVVYLALNERANKTWAIKEVRKDGGNDTTVVSQGLAAETEMLKKLSHPNLPSIIDVIDQDESFIIVMDYIEGNSLQHLLDTSGAQHPDKVIEWAKQVCDVLGYLHSRRPPIIYRDLKPANVMLKPNGEVTLIDFGTAREYKDTRNEDTAWLGTRGYAAPEQFGGCGQTDGRTDIYNLGATMYHLVTGYSPADTNFVIHPIGKFLPRMKGSGLEKLICKCCEPAPADRYQSAAELMYALDHVHDEDNEVISSRNRRWNAFITVAVIALIALIGGFVFRSMYKNSLGNIYNTYISDAETKQTLTEKIEEYRLAIELDPGRRDAWESMIQSIQNRDHEILTSGEVDEIRNCIKNGVASSNLEQLKKSDIEAYAKFNYELGYILFFSSGNGRNGAYDYLNEAVENKDRLEPAAAGFAEIMLELAEVDKNKNKNTVGWDSGKGYKDYWDTLNGLLNGKKATLDSLQQECGDSLPLAVCNEVASAIYQQLSNFKGQGVSRAEMESALTRARSFVQNTFYELNPDGSVMTDQKCNRIFKDKNLDENMKNRAESALMLIGDAEKNVERSFGGNTQTGTQTPAGEPAENPVESPAEESDPSDAGIETQEGQ